MIPSRQEKALRLEQRVRSAGLVASEPDDRDYVFVPQVTNVPERIRRDAIFPRVQNQGAEGICTGETMTTIAEAILNTQRVYRPGEDEFSRKFNYFYSRRYDGLVGDTGATPRSMCRSAKNYGLPLERLWPMSMSLDAEPGLDVREQALQQRLGRYEVITWDRSNMWEPARQIEAAFAEGCLVALAFFVKRWMFYVDGPLGSLGHQQGAMSNTDPLNEIVGGHIVPLRGYDRSMHPASGGAVVAQNSWDTDWGDEGLWSINYMLLSAPNFAMEIRVFRDFGGVSLAPVTPIPLTRAEIDADRAALMSVGLGAYMSDGRFNFADVHSSAANVAIWEILRRRQRTPEQAGQVIQVAPEIIRSFIEAPENKPLIDAWRQI